MADVSTTLSLFNDRCRDQATWMSVVPSLKAFAIHCCACAALCYTPAVLRQHLAEGPAELCEEAAFCSVLGLLCTDLGRPCGSASSLTWW